MSRRINLWWVLAALLCFPLLNMWLYPLADTTEPRYAEIARLMAQTGDWITPWFEPGVPFWGKPPLSFWMEALSFKLFGVSEFAARLPSWLATLGTVALLVAYTRSFFGKRTAQWAAIIYSSCALVYIASGAVMTDSFLALGTTFSMTAYAMAARKPTWFWRYGFFAGLAIGLLAKGPLVLVLVAGPIVPWLLWQAPERRTLRALPWGWGILLTLAISMPWYILAELKTPGFLNYFIVGEHFKRFIDPGWQGDLYGTAHRKAHGTIWLYWVEAAFPWGVLALGMMAKCLFNVQRRAGLKRVLHDPVLTYLLAWALFTPLFFTVSGNILWTYILPALGAFSILMAVALNTKRIRVESPKLVQRAGLMAGIAPLTIVVLTLVVVLRPMQTKTERDLVQHAQQQMHGQERLFYVDSRPFSARFYSNGEAGLLNMNQLPSALNGREPVYLAIPKSLVAEASNLIAQPMQKQFENQRYVLFEVKPKAQLAHAGNPAH